MKIPHGCERKVVRVFSASQTNQHRAIWQHIRWTLGVEFHFLHALFYRKLAKPFSVREYEHPGHLAGVFAVVTTAQFSALGFQLNAGKTGAALVQLTALTAVREFQMRGGLPGAALGQLTALTDAQCFQTRGGWSGVAVDQSNALPAVPHFPKLDELFVADFVWTIVRCVDHRSLHRAFANAYGDHVLTVVRVPLQSLVIVQEFDLRLGE